MYFECGQWPAMQNNVETDVLKIRFNSEKGEKL